MMNRYNFNIRYSNNYLRIKRIAINIDFIVLNYNIITITAMLSVDKVTENIHLADEFLQVFYCATKNPYLKPLKMARSIVVT